MSIQRKRRISESIRLSINGGRISGDGTDTDGSFDLQGSYDIITNRVNLTRRYSRTTEPDQASVGIPFDYTGEWDGEMVSGQWRLRLDPIERGLFEMWPSREEDMEGLRLNLKEQTPLQLS